MSRSSSRSHRPEATKRLTATITLRGQQFRFHLFSRPLVLGTDATIQYYWMDSSQLRSLKSRDANENFRNCVGHWQTAVVEMGSWDLSQQVHFITALCYPLVCKSKSLQHIYKDAFLAPGAVRSADMALPDEIRMRIHRVVQDRNRLGVQQELDAVLGRYEPPARSLPLFQEAFRHWVGNGVVWMRQDREEGVRRFLGEVSSWLSKYRKKGGNVWVRQFINMFAYECQVSFYRCFVNTWIDLIPWLREHHGLDKVSERFLVLQDVRTVVQQRHSPLSKYARDVHRTGPLDRAESNELQLRNIRHDSTSSRPSDAAE